MDWVCILHVRKELEMIHRVPTRTSAIDIIIFKVMLYSLEYTIDIIDVS